MYRTLVLTVSVILLAAPMALAQERPDETPGGRPTDTAGPDPTDDTRPTGTGRGDTPADRDGPRGPPVEIEDRADGFGARPTDAGRPAFSYDAGRAALALERTGAPAMTGGIDAVIEFHDTDGDGAYDLGEPVVARHALQELPVEMRAPNDRLREAVYRIGDNGTVTLRFHLSPSGQDVAAKFDVVLEQFPFSDDTSRVALGVRTETTSDLRLGSVDGVPALLAEGDGDRPYLSWLPNATADGQDVAVGTSVHFTAESGEGVVYWAYPQAAMLVHDPLLGYVTIPVETLGDVLVFTAALASGGALMLAGFEARRRFRA